MPGREDPSEAPVFVERQTGVAEVSNQYSEPRDMTPTGVAAREPFEVHDRYDADNAAEAKNEEVEVSIEDVVNNIIIHDDKPIENLPRMEAPELKLIGRCVSLCVLRKVNEVEQLFYYTGLVSSVTFTAVTLMHVNRYTREDFKIYVAREKQVTKDGLRAEKQVTGSATGRVSGLPSHGYTAEGEVGVERDGGLAGTQDAAALLRLDAAGSLAPAIDLPTADDAATAEVPTSPLQPDAAAPPQTSTRALRHRQFRECDTSLGPIPYMTFLRKNIHDVRFGRDPRSSFYSLFQDPSREITDMQYLRMFVRRYLVHTSEGNNPRQVPLYAFVTVRCACPDMDRELVNRVAREELPGLMQADENILRRKSNLRPAGAMVHDEGASPNMRSQTFSANDVMFFFLMSRFFLLVSWCIFLLGSLFLFLIIVFLFLSKDYLEGTLHNQMTWVALSLLGSNFVAALGSFGAGAGCRKMVFFPVWVPFYGLLFCFLPVINYASFLLYGISVPVSLKLPVQSGAEMGKSLYLFYESHHCSGLYKPCAALGNSNALCNSCNINYPFTSCGEIIWQKLHPMDTILCFFCALGIIVSLVGMGLHLRMFFWVRAKVRMIKSQQQHGVSAGDFSHA